MNVKSVRSAGDVDAVVVGMYAGVSPAPGTQSVMRSLGAWVRRALAAAEFEGKAGQVAVIPSPETPSRRVVFVGLGDDLDLEGLRQAAGAARNAVANADSVATTLHKVPLDGAVGGVLDGFGLADYRFEAYKSTARSRPELSVELIGADKGWDEEAARSASVVEAVCLARDLVNEPSINKPPMALAERIAAAASEVGVGVEIWEMERLREERMGGIIGVGQGSARPPCLLQLHYKPRRPKAKLALVGKGIVFDTGGISLKPAERMEEMKGDMAGAAAACAAVIAIASLGLPVEVKGYGAFAENMPGGSAQRPGDVLTTRNGKTIEVLNTDAEGRLVLSDAIALAAEWSPDLIVDLATLTGAIVVALGPKIAGVFGNDQSAIERVVAAAGSAGERVWPMPLPDDYRSMIDSEVADMKNTGQGRYGGAISAAMLLREFPGDAPWVHIDLAGPAYYDKAEHYVPKAGTGFGVRTLVELAKSMA